MTLPDPPVSAETEMACFIKTLREVFEDEHWDEIRPWAAKAWMQCGLLDGKTWSEVETLVREAWHDRGPRPIA
jgi:hypothetical protein